MYIAGDLIRGHTETIILARLMQRDSYGYEINKTVRELSGGRYELKEATLYTAFKRLEETGQIMSYWGSEATGARRRYYRITPAGRMAYQEQVIVRRTRYDLKKAREPLGERAKILAGILPVVSQRNAIFMENEVNGIHVDDAIIQRFEGLDRAAGEELGLEVSVQAAKAAAPYADGFYLMTPFNRVALMERLIARLRTEVTG